MNLRQAKKLYHRTKNKFLHYRAKAVLSKHHALGVIMIPKDFFEKIDIDTFAREWRKWEGTITFSRAVVLQDLAIRSCCKNILKEAEV